MKQQVIRSILDRISKTNAIPTHLHFDPGVMSETEFEANIFVHTVSDAADRPQTDETVTSPLSLHVTGSWCGDTRGALHICGETT